MGEFPMHKVVREVESGHGLVPVNHYIGSLPEARCYACQFGGTIWYYCPTHGWAVGELCSKNHKRLCDR